MAAQLAARAQALARRMVLLTIAISGGPFAGSPACRDGVGGVIPGATVDLWIPGCPPHPVTLLDGLLRLLGRIERDDLRLAGTGVLEPDRAGAGPRTR